MSMPSSFELGRAIGGNIAGGIQQGQETSMIDKILNQASASGNPEDIQNVMGQILQRVAPERQQVASQILGNKLQELQAKRTSQAQAQAYAEQGLNPNLPESVNREILKKRSEVGSVQETGQRSFDTLANILNQGRVGRGAKLKALAGGKTAEDVGAFEAASGGLESMLVDMVSRGTLSNARFRYITETLLPKPNDTEARIRGKLKSLADLLQLDSSSLSTKGKKLESKPSDIESVEFVQIRDPQGKIRSIPKEMIEAAKNAGGQLIQ